MIRTLIRHQLQALAVWSAVTVSIVSGVMLNQAATRGEAETAVELSQQETGFWRVVAGVDSGNQPGVGNSLARDLRVLLDDPQGIEQFRGNSNRYGGITDAIGYDPFDETGLDCFECGPLDERTKRNLTSIREGHLDDVLGTVVVEPPVEGFDVVPGDMGLLMALILWYLAGSTVAFGAALATSGVRISDQAGPATVDDQVMLVLAPLPVGWLRLTRRMRVRRLEDQVRGAFPDHMRMLDQTDKVLDRYGDVPAAIEARSHRDQVYAELVAQTRAGNDGSSEIDSLTSQLGETMDFLRLRAEARKELG